MMVISIAERILKRPCLIFRKSGAQKLGGG